MYQVKSIFYTLQGEGAQAGRPAVFCRFSGCNLWSGQEVHRQRAACRFCDTDFVGTSGSGGGIFADAASLAASVANHWPKEKGGKPYVVLTGGEPLLQLDQKLSDALHQEGFEIAVETNGTLSLKAAVDWLCVSPKAGTSLVLTQGDELKVVVPQEGMVLEAYEGMDFRHFYVQPMDEKGKHQANIAWALDFALRRPHWSFSMQMHKVLGIE